MTEGFGEEDSDVGNRVRRQLEEGRQQVLSKQVHGDAVIFNYRLTRTNTRIKNTHLNQAIHEEREAIIELRVQLRLLQTEKVKQEQQQGQENGGEELGKRTASFTSVQLQKDPMGTETKAGKDPLKPSPSKDSRETPI
ncbi:UNVERIFIED_CONTAM: hypothetical protein FKN15_068599 [Acipenser sinensis]